VAKTAAETTAEQVAKTVAEDAARTAGEGAARTAGEGAARTAGEGAAKTAGEGAAKTAGEGAAKTAGEGAAKTAGEAGAEITAGKMAGVGAAKGAGKAGAETTAGKAPAESAERAADDATAQAGKAGSMGGAELPPGPLPGAPVPAPEDLSFDELLSRYGDRLTVDGQPVTQRELDFAGVSPKKVADALSGTAPLGTSPTQWAALQSDLTIAMRESGLEGVQLEQAGSSIRLFAGRAKPFPQSADDAAAQAAANGHDAAEAGARYSASPYADAGSRPGRHFFDSRYKLGIDLKSDIDFSISGPEVSERMARFKAQHPEIKDLVSSHGGVYKTRYLRQAFPELSIFMDRWTAELGGREVNIVGKVAP
jgi:hypothetical protein